MVSACAGERIQLPDFEEATRIDEEVTDPSNLPLLCSIPWQSASCWQAIGVYEDVAEGNTQIAQLNADIARDSDEAYDYILSGAKNQQVIVQIREEMYEAEKRDHMLDNWFHRILLAIGIGLAL